MNKKHEKEELNFWDTSAKISENPMGQEAIVHANMLNSKVCALLTHVTVMIAIATFFLNYNFEHDIYDKKLVFDVNMTIMADVVLYLAITLLCMRGIWATNKNSYKNCCSINEAINKRLANISRRKAVYLYALWLTILTTIMFVLSLTAKYMVITWPQLVSDIYRIMGMAAI